jgi:hypothetical protein
MPFDVGQPTDDVRRARDTRGLPQGQRVWSGIRASTPLAEVAFTRQPGRGGTTRFLRQGLHAQAVRVADRHASAIQATDRIGQEVDAWAGVQAIAWRRLADCTLATLEVAAESIDRYRARWDIEVLVFITQAASRFEALELERQVDG